MWRRCFPSVGETGIRGHGLRVKGRPFRTEMRRNSFSRRVGESVELIATEEAGSLSVFRTGTDRFLTGKEINGYGEKAGEWDLRNLSAMIEWRSRLDGPNGQILLLYHRVIES